MEQKTRRISFNAIAPTSLPTSIPSTIWLPRVISGLLLLTCPLIQPDSGVTAICENWFSA
jgi:hypothetical protein